MSSLAVVTMIENPLQWWSRIGNYAEFKKHIESSDADLYTAEVAFGDRPFVVTDSGNKRHLQLRTTTEIWHKENALNLLIQRLPDYVDNIAWMDADIHFARRDWVEETCKQLEHYPVVQMFSHAQNLGSSYHPIGVARPGYFFQYKEEGEIYGGIKFWDEKTTKIPNAMNAHPGLAFAIRKETLSAIGGLFEYAITGSGDFHMDAAFLGELGTALDTQKYSMMYRAACSHWQMRANRVVTAVGYVPGLVLHNWHGSIGGRKYAEYRTVLQRWAFDPYGDLVRDWQGLYTLAPSDRTDGMATEIREYLRARNDDQSDESRLLP